MIAIFAGRFMSASSHKRLSILSRASQADWVLAPYPHLVIENALPPALYQQLESEFPADGIILDGRAAKDTWFDYPASKVVHDKRISGLWREFFAYHTSKAFFDELLALAGPHILALAPDIERRAGRKLEDFKVAMRPGGRDEPLAPHADASMECQFYLNYSRQSRTVRGPHVDRPSELFAALLYFRHNEDDSLGSDLEICEEPTHARATPREIEISELPAEIDPARVRTVKTVRYAANTLVLFLNAAHAIHAVTPRTATKIARRHINFCCDVRFDLFDLKLPMRLATKQSLAKLPMGWRLAKYL
jgi:hypothetical protein